ncbi:CAP domain-containing protein [Bacillus coahuilensis]|uniref:CAP domain-containing protein n=1 Tax=Bacillus coahuilensis TaxID=408580 RepID=UPI000AECEAAD|nr:CAP domain-containing protein [Bacillus coahuilensis]
MKRKLLQIVMVCMVHVLIGCHGGNSQEEAGPSLSSETDAAQLNGMKEVELAEKEWMVEEWFEERANPPGSESEDKHDDENDSKENGTEENGANIESEEEWKKEILRLVNTEREKEGLPDLTLDELVSETAQAKAVDLMENGYFAHESPTYGSPFNMLSTFGVSYTAAGENIAAGQTTPEQVVKEWMESPGHRANILNASFTDLGVGYAEGGSYGTYWVQMFVRE